MLYGEHLHTYEQPPQCGSCARRATVEVFDKAKRSCGIFCLRCGKRKLAAVQRIEDLFARKKNR
jgi:hypothetical protein